jgi:hypothetical protein
VEDDDENNNTTVMISKEKCKAKCKREKKSQRAGFTGTARSTVQVTKRVQKLRSLGPAAL